MEKLLRMAMLWSGRHPPRQMATKIIHRLPRGAFGFSLNICNAAFSPSSIVLPR